VRRLAGFALLATPLLAQAGGVLDAGVSEDKGVYALSVEARIDAPVTTVFRLITDYDHLHAINPAVRESRILRTFSPSKHRVRTVTRVCVLFYCRDVTQTQDIVQSAGYVIVADVLPQDSDFRSGQAHWRLTPEGDATLLRFQADIVPDFFMPPLIGPWLIRREMVNQMTEIVRLIEVRYEGRPAP
jgi:uncharacterized protein YndB with AHSA1/START domain